MTFGRVAFLGSGETSLAGGRIFEALARLLPTPLRIAILETPAGFELNSAQVAGRVGDFLKSRLQNYDPVVDVVPARRLDSANDPQIIKPLLHADMIFMGPGSPTYTIRHLKDTLAWDIIRARQRVGATLVFASAATISVGAHALPVYEIYKVGEDVHTVAGLNLFHDFGLHLSFIPHWNNAEGGADLDTSRCFVGMERFGQWHDLLSNEDTVIGLDEHTGVIMDLETGLCEVHGVSSVSIVRGRSVEMHASGAKFQLKTAGNFRLPDTPELNIPLNVWGLVMAQPPLIPDTPPGDVIALAEKRLVARAEKNWAESDRLRDEISAHGWSVQDGRDGYSLVRS
jgi:hypothetical protein